MIVPPHVINRKLVTTQAPASVLLVRLAVGMVFLSEGIQKYLLPDALGPGRFAKIGFSHPEALAHLVGLVEITCGAFLLVGLLTRIAVIPLIVVMVTALVTTKLPILLGRELWGFHLRDLPEYGFWAMAHEARTDFLLLAGSLFLLLAGGGRWSLDARLAVSEPDTPVTELFTSTDGAPPETEAPAEHDWPSVASPLGHRGVDRVR
jgi:uncharacterized membrane protein YphA (DoxX/SURF4 family)